MSDQQRMDSAKRFVITTGYDDCGRCKGSGCLVADHFEGNGTRRTAITCPTCLDRAIAEGR